MRAIVKAADGEVNRVVRHGINNLLLALVALATLAGSHVNADEPPGLVALYTFQEGSGTNVMDVSGAGTPLNLAIENAALATWLPGGGLALAGGDTSRVVSSGAATKVIEAAQVSNELTVEALLKPGNLTQSGPARVVGISGGTGDRNFTLGQLGNIWEMRLRTTDTGGAANNGLPPLDTAAGVVQAALMHVVYTRSADGTERMYVDGVEMVNGFRGGDFSNWAPAYRLLVGNEEGGSRPWAGEIYRVAIYDRALGAAEVAQQFDELVPKLEITQLSPIAGTLFHPAANGISFRAVALSDNTIAQNDVRLTLNGQDRSAQLQFAGDNKNWQVTLSGLASNTIYNGEISIRDNLGRTQLAALSFETFSPRADGLVVLYDFQEGSGSTIRDTAGAGSTPLDLSIASPADVSWLPGGGLIIESPAQIASTIAAEKIRQTAQQNNALSVEAWIRSTDPSLEGSARIVTVSEFRNSFPDSPENNSLRNFTLAQQTDSYQFFLRTTETDQAGQPPVVSPAQTDITRPVQVAYTRDATGQARLYVNGSEVANELVGGDLSNWFGSYRLGIGGELNFMDQAPANHPRRFWLGELYRVRIYHRALTPQEVAAGSAEFVDFLAGKPPVLLKAAGQPGFTNVVLTFSKALDASSATDVANYQVSGGVGVLGALLEPVNKLTVTLTTTAQQPETVHTVTVNGVLDDTPAQLAVAPNSTATFLTASDRFVKGINLNGPVVTIEGNQWISQEQAELEGFFSDGLRFAAAYAFPLIPAPDLQSRTMLQSLLYSPGFASGAGFFLEMPLDNGDYDIFLWMVENASGDNRDIDVQIEGLTAATAIGGLPLGEWRKYGPYKATVLDSSLSVEIVQHSKGDPLLCGLAVFTSSLTPATYPLTVNGGSGSGTYTNGAQVTITANPAPGQGFKEWVINWGNPTTIADLNAAATTLTMPSWAVGVTATYTNTPPGTGLVALYTFQEGGGTTVQDVSGVGVPLNLEIANAAAVDWLPGGGLSLNSSVLIASALPATKLLEAAQASNALTVEALLKPANLTQTGPARAVSMSGGTGERNFTLGQAATTWQMRTRTTNPDPAALNGLPVFDAAGVAKTRLMHVVYTRDTDGSDVLYVDGVQVATRSLSGDFSNWADTYPLVLGNEATGDRPWLGEFHRVAIYSRPLTAAEVAQLFAEVAPLQFLPPVLSAGQITLNWTGTGQLEWAPTVLGPWAVVTPAPTPPYSEASVPDGSRFYRLKKVNP